MENLVHFIAETYFDVFFSPETQLSFMVWGLLPMDFIFLTTSCVIGDKKVPEVAIVMQT